MLPFQFDDGALRLLDALKIRLGLPSRGSVLDRAVTAMWRESIARTENHAWCSAPTDGSREDEILRRLHDLAVLGEITMSEAASLAIEQLYSATAVNGAVVTQAALIGT